MDPQQVANRWRKEKTGVCTGRFSGLGFKVVPTSHLSELSHIVSAKSMLLWHHRQVHSSLRESQRIKEVHSVKFWMCRAARSSMRSSGGTERAQDQRPGISR